MSVSIGSMHYDVDTPFRYQAYGVNGAHVEYVYEAGRHDPKPEDAAWLDSYALPRGLARKVEDGGQNDNNEGEK